MTLSDSTFAALAGASGEFLIACDIEGRVFEADDRAARIVGIRSGDSLHAVVAPGCGQKFADFLDRGCSVPVLSCEMPFVVEGRPLSASLSSRPSSQGMLVIGHLIPEGFAEAIAGAHAIISEEVDLNRTLFVQRNDIAARHAELVRLNRELSESHQAIVTLHQELQETSAFVRRESAIKSRLVDDLSHEVRTPLHAIVGLTQLLHSDTGSTLTDDQETQVGFIRRSAEELLALVDDMLDRSRVEAGHGAIRIVRFQLREFMDSLRGMLRPLVPSDGLLRLVMDDVPHAVDVETDRTKLCQIARNLVSNALKFTVRGEVRVRMAVAAGRLIIEVADTGVGIARSDIRTIFEEYGQVAMPFQPRIKGSGLGLPLSLRLAESLGGTIRVESTLGMGSTFTVDLPSSLNVSDT